MKAYDNRKTMRREWYEKRKCVEFIDAHAINELPARYDVSRFGTYPDKPVKFVTTRADTRTDRGMEG